MKNKMELLAPAGSREALHAAVENGADAVYLGGKLFNARQLADNFESEELEKALRYAHIRGVKIYLAMNTLVSDSEMEEALSYAGDACLMGVDGIIVQDLGFAAALKRTIPGVQLHASTQMTIYNAEGVRTLERMGFKRVVLARELSLEDIRRINESASIEMEVFVHGALCISYSGQCLMSSLIGGRSGNRGRCAQPCRLPWSLVRQGERERRPSYLMSPKDLCLLPYIGELAAVGVASLKIEGRMKSPEYVATVVRIYRKYLDLAQDNMDKGLGNDTSIDGRDFHDLLQIFNRGGFTNGYIKGKTGSEMMCYEKPKNWGIFLGKALVSDRRSETVKLRLEDALAAGDGIEAWNGEDRSPGTIVSSITREGSVVRQAGAGDIVTVGNIKGFIPAGCSIYKTSGKALNLAAAESYGGKPLKRVRLHCHAVLRSGSPLLLTVSDEDGNVVKAEGGLLPETAIHRPVTSERLKEQLGKTGPTPFELEAVNVELEENLSLPVSEINEVRRRALEELERKRAETGACPADKSRIEAAVRDEMNRPMPKRPERRSAPGISVYFYKLPANMDYAGLFPFIGADRLYLPFESFLQPGFKEVSDACRQAGSEVFLWLPQVTRGNYDRLIKTRLIGEGLSDIDGVLVGNPGTVAMLSGVKGLRLAGDMQLNVFNRFSLREAADMGLESVTLSPELTLGQAAAIAEGSSVTVEAVVYGRLPLMTSEYCPVGCTAGGFRSGSKCSGSCGTGDYKLKDRLGVEFPVFCDRIDCRSTILNSNVLYIPDSLKKLADSGIGLLRLYISDEKPENVRSLVELHRMALKQEDFKGLKELTEEIKGRGFTKGHYFRGV